MVNSFRIKEYVFPAIATNHANTTSGVSHSINGEILKIACTSNFTGSAIIQTEYGQTFGNLTNTSGTSTFSILTFPSTTGSFVVNSPLVCMYISGTSGTGNMLGPVSVYYR